MDRVLIRVKEEGGVRQREKGINSVIRCTAPDNTLVPPPARKKHECLSSEIYYFVYVFDLIGL